MSKYIIIVLGVCLVASHPVAAQNPSVTELMDKYAQTQEEFQPSFISKMETKAICTYNIPDYKVQANNVDRYSAKEFRWDDRRMKIIKKSWGWMHSRRTRDENHKAYNSWLFDGSNFYAYGNGTVNDQFVEGYPGKGSFKGGNEKKHSAQSARDMAYTDPFLGYFWDNKKQRVDERILHDKDASVHNKMQKVGEFRCYVITARPEKGLHLKVWVDPEHGYNIAKFEYRFGEGYDPIGPGRPYEEGSNTYLAGTISSFKKIDGIWVPWEMDYLESLKYRGRIAQKRSVHYKRTEFLINPDHDALGSFLPDDIPNGALIFAYGARYTWQDGKVVDSYGHEVNLETLKPPSLVGQALPGLTKFNLRFNPKLVEKKMVLVCFWDMNQRPSRNCVQNLNKRAQTLLNRNVYMVFVHAGPVAEQKLIAWLKNNKIEPPAGMSRANLPELGQSWGVQSLPWLILTDKKHIVRTEGFGINELYDKITALREE